MTNKFRKKPVIIEAMQFNGGWSGDGRDICDWVGKNAHWSAGNSGEPGTLHIQTLEGTMTAIEGDYIIRGVKGEFYPCKPDIFAATYDPIEVSEIAE
jgi:hypothetical protein